LQLRLRAWIGSLRSQQRARTRQPLARLREVAQREVDGALGQPGHRDLPRVGQLTER
jgi:hypothetical protein